MLFRSTWDQTNGDYDSGAGTISQGAWYHVAVSFDRGTLATPPVFYINGKKMTTVTLAAPAGTPPPLTGTGYIGNRYDGARGWNGQIDDLRIYNRILSENEVKVLAAMPMANLAPRVAAGENQMIVWPASAALHGAIDDDGNPFGTVALTWSQVSGNGLVTFANSNAAVTTATFPAPGDYGLRLVADDGQVKTSSDTSIAVVARPTINCALSDGSLRLSWETANLGWRLQFQTNNVSVGLSAGWTDVAGANTTNSMTIPVAGFPGTVFYRLVFP